MTSTPNPARHRGRLFVISGPSGVGKDSVIDGLKKLARPYHFTVTATTRAMRPGETDGIDYLFLSRADFRRMIENNGLLEWAEVYGNLYGVPKSQVNDALDCGKDVIMRIDVQGAATVRKLRPDAVLIFLEPPTWNRSKSVCGAATQSPKPSSRSSSLPPSERWTRQSGSTTA